MVDLGLHQAVLGALLAVAAAADVAQRRIPNALVALLAAAGLAAQWAAGGPKAAALGGLAGAGVLLLLFVPWATGKLGGGDAKLACAAAVWVGPAHLVDFLIFTALAGAPVALASRLARRAALALGGRQAAPILLAQTAAGPETVPYAVAIALGAVAALHWRLT